MTLLDLADERACYLADLDCEEHEGDATEDNPIPVIFPTVWVLGGYRDNWQWVCKLGEAEIVRLVVACRHALKLPLGDKLKEGIQETLGQAQEAAYRVSRRKRRSSGRGEAPGWQQFDLLGAVEALCGEGVMRGGQYWFRCPFHEDKTASLEVDADKRIWHAFCCGRKGGALAWQRDTAKIRR